jgi:hypothetical protein
MAQEYIWRRTRGRGALTILYISYTLQVLSTLCPVQLLQAQRNQQTLKESPPTSFSRLETQSDLSEIDP